MLILDVLGHQAYIQFVRQCVNVERHMPLRRTPPPLFLCLIHSSINFMLGLMHLTQRKRCKIKTLFNFFHYPSFLGYRVIGLSNLKLLCIKIDLQRWLFHLKNEIPLWNLIPLCFWLQCQRCHERAIFLWKLSSKLFVLRVHLSVFDGLLMDVAVSWMAQMLH